MNINIINLLFKYSDMDMVSNVKYIELNSF